MPQSPTLTLNTGATIPQLGFGVWQVPSTEVVAAVEAALQAGYRSIDTAMIYENERGVGEAIAAGDVPREQLFVTTKLWNADHGRDRVPRALETSLERLALDFVDLYLMHWPVPSADRYVETWRAMEALLADGRVKAIGVCNFQVAHLERLLAEADVVPAVNQIELHPRLGQAELRGLHARHGILTEAWSPLAQGRALDDPTIARIANAHGRTPAQAILRWHLQLGNVVIPKSVTPRRIEQNIDVFDFRLSDAELAEIEALDRGERVGPDPDVFDFGAVA